MAGTGIQNEIGAPLVKPVARPVFLAPAIFTNFEAELHSVEGIHDVSDRESFVTLHAFDDAVRDSFIEPLRFVVNAVACEVLLESDPEDRLVADHTRVIVGCAFVPEGKAYRDRDVVALVLDGKQFLPRPFAYPLAEKKIFAAVTRDTQFGKAQQVHVLTPGFFNRLKDMSGVVGPVNGSLVDGGACYFHFVFCVSMVAVKPLT